jgi:hypothetical protein
MEGFFAAGNRVVKTTPSQTAILYSLDLSFGTLPSVD